MTLKIIWRQCVVEILRYFSVKKIYKHQAKTFLTGGSNNFKTRAFKECMNLKK